MDQKELIEKITNEVMNRIKDELEIQKQDNMAQSAQTDGLTARDVAGLIDHTLLKPDATEEQYDKLCEEAKQYDFCSVCVNSSWV